MAKLRVAVILAIFSAFIYTIVEGKSNRLHVRDDSEERHGIPCTNNPNLQPYLPPCSTSAPTTISTTTTTTAATTSTSTPSSLERAHWCRQNNGSYLPLGYTYMQGKCMMCQCLQSRMIRCGGMQCMPTYCIDNSKPIIPQGQCCTQCPYELSNTACVYNGITYQHGTIIKAVQNQMQCWCQLGNIECRDYIGSLFEGADLWSDGTAVYVIVLVLLLVLLLGLFTCCGCTCFIYYYYHKYQHSFQQAYDEYVASSGWQPVEEEQQTPDELIVDEKKFEAENAPTFAATLETIPPPYAAVHTVNTAAHEQLPK